jgi:CIC family chloride channel protein
MYGVGYPVMDRAIAGHIVVGLVLLFMLAKILASNVMLSIGGSGGVFAPSLFTGAMGGEAFGIGVHHLFGASVGPPALYAVVVAVCPASSQTVAEAQMSGLNERGDAGRTRPSPACLPIACP